MGRLLGHVGSRGGSRPDAVGLVCACLLLLGAVAGCKETPPQFVLGVTHRVFSEFREVHKVQIGQDFTVGDEDYSARLIQFVPDFVMDMTTGEVSSRSDEPKNPAVRVEVLKGGEPVDTVWAFPGSGAPHFARDSYLAFELLDFPGAKAAASRDRDDAGKPNSGGTGGS